MVISPAGFGDGFEAAARGLLEEEWHAIGESNQDLIYILQWESLAERDQKFAAFQRDPEWIEARRKSEEDGPLLSSITNSIWTPTAFSASK